MSLQATKRHVRIPIEEVSIVGDLSIPVAACGVVLFAHGSGSGRLSSRNRFVAEQLNQRRLATLLIDLLTEQEEREDVYSGHLRFDMGFLADRLNAARTWLLEDLETQALPVGLFGASTGAAAALASSIHRPEEVGAVVSRGGRPDLAGAALPQVQAPTLLIVGSRDTPVIPLNQEALTLLGTEVKQIEIVEGASHLFEEPGKLEVVAALAGEWFEKHLCGHR
jgi:putative phosphoribosyl transferase